MLLSEWGSTCVSVQGQCCPKRRLFLGNAGLGTRDIQMVGLGGSSPLKPPRFWTAPGLSPSTVINHLVLLEQEPYGHMLPEPDSDTDAHNK